MASSPPVSPWPVPPKGHVRVATWNVERIAAKSWKRRPRILEHMAAVGADVWILTETRASLSPGPGLHGLHAPPHPSRRPDPDERWVSVWSRWPMEPTAVEASPRGTVAAVVRVPAGPLLVYGTVIPWGNEPDADGRVGMWREHERELERQGIEWRELRRLHPGVPLIVAGDFNQDRDGSGWYWTRRVRALLSEELDRAGLAVATADDMVAAGQLETHLVDHVAADAGVVRRGAHVRGWPPRSPDGVRLSDHPGVAADLAVWHAADEDGAVA